MFHKEGSFRGGAGSKKAKDTPIKKSERRKLRSQCVALLASTYQNHSGKGDEEHDDGSSSPGTDVSKLPVSFDQDPRISSMLDSIFLDTKADILLRKIKQPDAKSNAGATVIYIRTPSSSSPSTTIDSKEDEQEMVTKWPYTQNDQPILIQISTPYSTSNGTKNITITLPTVALLSAVLMSPSICTSMFHLPAVTVPPQVSKYLCRGANLMRSGMLSIQNVSFQSNMNTIPWVCIKVSNNPQPFAIGLLTKGTTNENILGSENNKGIGVEIITCYGDDIYQAQVNKGRSHHDGGVLSCLGGAKYDHGNYGNVGFEGGKYVHGLVVEGNDNGEEEGGMKKEEGEIDANETDHANEDNEAKNLSQLNITSEKNDKSDNQDDEKQPSTLSDEEEQEQNLLYAFHTSLLTISKKDLPMAVSTYYSQFLLPARKDGTYLDIKQTKFKKISTFLMDQSKNRDGRSGLCIVSVGASKDKQDPVAFLTSIDRSHCDLRDARRRRKALIEDDGNTKKGKTKLAVVNLYIIPEKVATLLRLSEDLVKATNAKSEERRGTGFLTMPECREILNQYVKENELVDEYDPENVTLDGPLCDVLYKKSKKQAGYVSNQDFPESITRKELNDEWLKKMESAYAIVSMPGSVIIGMKRGKPPMVSIEVECRQNRKKFVTRVRGLEDYTINVSDFGSDVSKRFACSASIEDEHSLSAGRPVLKKGRSELVFQGHLVEELQALLLGNEKLSSHGGTKDSIYCLPKGVFDVILKKGVPKRKK